MPRTKFKFQFFVNPALKQKHRVRIVSSNGKIIFTSEFYLHKSAPRKTVNAFIEAIKKNQYKIES